MSELDYHNVRIPYDKKRKMLWSVLVKDYFSKYISVDHTVLELGAGYCDFINEVSAKKKYAIDVWPDFPEYAHDSVECLIGDIKDLSEIKDNSLDFVFASNIFEHITHEDLSSCLMHLQRKIRKNGLLAIMQPNFKRCYKDYFDDYTHVSIWTDVGLSDFLIAHGFTITFSSPGFLPMTLKSCLPVSPLLIKAYLASPIKPMAKQMLIMAKR